MISKIILITIIGISGALAHALCFLDTSLGGYLPFIFLTFAPLVTYHVGVVKGALEFSLWLKTKGIHAVKTAVNHD